MKKNPEITNNTGNTSKESDALLQKTNDEIREMLFKKEVEESTTENIAKKVKELNPNVEIIFWEMSRTLYSSAAPENLILPEGFYYNEKNWITNKHNTKTGAYGSLHVAPIECYDPNFEKYE